ncbi:MAG: phosphoribosylamine--glycine ligase [Flavihumibacter sp.]
MNILLLGSGGREHALAWKMKTSPLCDELFIAPGNAGTAQVGTNLNVAATDFPAIARHCEEKNISLLVVGPEEPLVKGIVDYFKTNHPQIAVIGPSAYGAQLEGSKAFAKAFMERHGIPTAAYREFSNDNFDEGVAYIRQHSLPVVLKADGLAAGKGVLIINDHEEAVIEFTEMIRAAKFGAAGSKVVIEQFLAGIEMSVFILTDGQDYILLPSAKDYKRIGEGDTGLNTGGMGAVSPVPFADAGFMEKVIDRVVEPTVHGLAVEEIDYTGFVFIGLIKVGDDPYVIEYNCRMGDPETEVVMPRLASDLVAHLLAAVNGGLAGQTVQHDERVACAVMAVSGGYPGDYEKGKKIGGLDRQLPAVSLLFHAGTAEKNGEVLTAGGRVLCVTSYAADIPAAVAQSEKVLEGIHFDGMYYRRDIGFEFK